EGRPELVGVDPADGVQRARLPDHQVGLLVGQHLFHALGEILGRHPRPDEADDLDVDARKLLLEHRLEAGRIGRTRAVGPGENGGAGADHGDGELVLLLHGLGHVLQLVASKQQIAGDVAGLGGEGRAGQQIKSRSHGGRCNGRFHASPPARSASGVFLGRDPGLRPSALLYQVSRPATATMMIMPSPLSRNCIHTAPEISTMAKWAAKDRNTPRQKISNECCPHTIGGQSQRDLSPGQSRGRKRTVTTASARKCAKRNTSRLTLSIGYIRPSSQCGTYWPTPGRYQVSEMTNANNRYAAATDTVTGDCKTRESRWAPPSAHQAPNTNSNCQANGLKYQWPSG